MATKHKSLKPLAAPSTMKTDLQEATNVVKKMVFKTIKKCDPTGEHELLELVDNQLKMVVAALKHEYETKITELQTKILMEARDKTPLSNQEILLIAAESGLDIRADSQGELHWFDDGGEYIFDELLYEFVRNIEHAFGIEEPTKETL